MNSNTFLGKKLLVLGGAYQHVKIVKAAKEMGIVTHVTDYCPFEESPAKQIADHAHMYNITDVENIASLCREEHIDGVIAPYLDVTQKPYQMLCEKMGFYCFGDKEQHRILTDKIAFKSFCEEHGVDVIPYYREKDIVNAQRCDKIVEFPIIIKPCDSRGSRGQSICFERDEALKGIELAKSETSGNIVLEKYMGTDNDLQLAYMVVNSEPTLVKVEDRYLGDPGSGVENLCIAAIVPSRYEVEYRKKVDARVVSMIKAFGLKNAPIFIQGFWDKGTVRFYDPGLRLPGDNFDLAYKSAVGVDLSRILITYALTGIIPEEVGKQIKNAEIQKPISMILPCVRPGKIFSVQGLHEIEDHPHVLSVFTAYKEGDTVGRHNDVRQRFGEFVVACDDFDQLKATIDWLFSVLRVIDVHGNDMLYAKFDTTNLKKYMIPAG